MFSIHTMLIHDAVKMKYIPIVMGNSNHIQPATSLAPGAQK